MLGRSWDSEIFEILNLKKCQNSLSGNASDLWQHSYRICKKIFQNRKKSTTIDRLGGGNRPLWVFGTLGLRSEAKGAHASARCFYGTAKDMKNVMDVNKI